MENKHHGKPCRRCGETLHYNTGGCVSCARVKTKSWVAANKDRRREIAKRSDDRHRERRAASRQERRERYNAQRRERYSRDKAIILARAAAYKRANKDQINANCAARRARANNPGNKYDKNDVTRMFAAQGGLCVYCRAYLHKYHVDHIMPLALGGCNDPSNLQLLCPPCNLTKNAKHPDQFLAERAGI